MKKNECYNWNPFVKGFISDEDRNKKLKFVSGNYEFYSETIDLYKGLKITFIKDNINEAPTLQSYTHALAEFMMAWERDIRSHLNGFTGFESINIKFLGFSYIKLS